MANKLFLALFVLAFLILPLASAELSISGIKERYNLGDRIPAIISIKAERDIDGLISTSLSCGEYYLEYYRTPLRLTRGQAREINITGLRVIGAMQGNCNLEAETRQLEGERVEQAESREFKATSNLEMELRADSTEILPGQTFLLEGAIKPTYTEFSGVAFKTSLTAEINLTATNFSILVKTADDMRSGSTTITAEAADYYNNRAKAAVTITIKQVATKLEVTADREAAKPNSTIRFDVNAYDQAGEQIKQGAAVSIVGPDGKAVYEGEVETIAVNRYNIEAKAAPGKYTIRAKAAALEAEEVFIVEEVSGVDIQLHGQKVIVKNTGNVNYDRTIEVELSKDGKTYMVLKKVSLNPGEEKTIELSKEVPEGDYNVALPEKEDSAAFSGVKIEDKRSLLTRIAQALSSIMGGAVMETSATGSKMAIVILLLLVIGGFPIIMISNRRLRHELISAVTERLEREKKGASTPKEALKKAGAEKSRIEEIFSKHIDPAIVRELIEVPENRIHGEEREVTVLFSDIRGFTALSEKEDPWFIVNLLNMYFESIGSIVRKNSGTINKPVGDSIMALFNAPKKQPDHLAAAIRAAIEMRKELKKLNENIEKKGKKPIEMGIGINTGKAIIGNIGSTTKMEYTAIGDTVNAARRLQQHGTGSQILITEEAYSKIRGRIIADRLIPIRLNNTEKPVQVYNIIGLTF